MGAPPTTAWRRLPRSAGAKSGCSASIRYWVGTPISMVTRALGDQLQHPARLETPFQDHRGAGPPRQQRLDVPPAHMELGQHRQHHIGAGHLHGPGEREVGPEAVGMGQDGGLAGPLGAGGEDHQEGVVVAHCPAAPRPRPRLPPGTPRRGAARTFRRRRGPGAAVRGGWGSRRAAPRRPARPGRPPPAAARGPPVRAARTSSRGDSRQDSGTRTSPALAQAKNSTTWSELLPVRVAIRSPVP